MTETLDPGRRISAIIDRLVRAACALQAARPRAALRDLEAAGADIRALRKDLREAPAGTPTPDPSPQGGGENGASGDGAT